MSISNKRSHRMRTGPHDYGPREWGVFFIRHTRGDHPSHDISSTGSGMPFTHEWRAAHKHAGVSSQ